MAEKSETEIQNDNSSVKPKIFFNEISPRYPKVTENGKIETFQFLEASRSSIYIYGRMALIHICIYCLPIIFSMQVFPLSLQQVRIEMLATA